MRCQPSPLAGTSDVLSDSLGDFCSRLGSEESQRTPWTDNSQLKVASHSSP